MVLDYGGVYRFEARTGIFLGEHWLDLSPPLVGPYSDAAVLQMFFSAIVSFILCTLVIVCLLSFSFPSSVLT